MNLNRLMEFDYPVTVHEDGTVTDGPNGVYAPSLLDGELDGNSWEFFTYGYTGQDRYNGPVMHDSEFIGGQLERDILATPGVYVAIPACYTNEDEDFQDAEPYTIEGWAIVTLKDIKQ